MTDQLDAMIASVVQSVCDLPDRTSPEDWPEALLITGGELSDLLRDFAQGVRSMPTGDPTTSKCPRCESPDPKLHPAVQHGGEVHLCPHPFHDPKVPDPSTEREAALQDAEGIAQRLAEGATAGLEHARRDYSYIAGFADGAEAARSRIAALPRSVPPRERPQDQP